MLDDALLGLINVDGREFMYIELRGKEGFHQVLDAAFGSCPNVPLPNEGGAVEEPVQIALPDGVRLLAISYKGDLVGWKRKLTSFCSEQGRLWGIPHDARLLLSSGVDLDLRQTKIVHS